MGIFIMTGDYSPEAMKEMSAERTGSIVNLIQDCGGSVESMYALLGERDLIFIVDFPGTEQAMKASVTLSRSTGISFTTYPAVKVEDFDSFVS
jgi:uncharacterized protein with GYD domain